MRTLHDIFGATADRALMIRVTNVPDLVKKQGGKVGEILNTYAPDTMNSEVYSQLAAQLKPKMAEQGLKIDAQMVDPSKFTIVNDVGIGWKIATFVLASAIGIGGITYWWKTR